MDQHPPWTSNSFDATLHGLIIRQDYPAIRDLFDKAFWENQYERPKWGHLKMALWGDNSSIIRYLITWGAPVTEEYLAELKADPQMKDKYNYYVSRLRQCGLNMRVEPAKEDRSPPQEALPVQDGPSEWDHFLANFSLTVPSEWKQVLRAFHENGPKEAIIAGGAVRDILNKRPVKDVDIFLRSRGNQNKNRKFLKKVFKSAGIRVKEQVVSDGSSPRHDQFPGPAAGEIKSWAFESHRTIDKNQTESWKVIAGPDNTEYNVVFISGRVSKWTHNHVFVDALLRGFDVGLCQAAFDGRRLITTTAFKEDVRLKTITLTQPNNTSKEHLARIAKKYPDWQLCPEAEKLLNPDPQIGEKIPGEGIYAGTWFQKDENGKKLGKTFNVFAAPEDLPKVMTYDDAVNHLSRLKGWHGFDGANYATDKEIYAAVADGSYKSGWIIPPRELLTGTNSDAESGVRNGKGIQPDNLFGHQTKGAFRGTFKAAASDGSDCPGWYWSSTGRDKQPCVWVSQFSSGHEQAFLKNYLLLSCRPVRLSEKRLDRYGDDMALSRAS
jgi:hypothetical protein